MTSLLIIDIEENIEMTIYSCFLKTMHIIQCTIFSLVPGTGNSTARQLKNVTFEAESDTLLRLGATSLQMISKIERQAFINIHTVYVWQWKHA